MNRRYFCGSGLKVSNPKVFTQIVPKPVDLAWQRPSGCDPVVISFPTICSMRHEIMAFSISKETLVKCIFRFEQCKYLVTKTLTVPTY